MQRAKELLETTFLNAKEITAETGYKDESHFVQNFKAAYGATPLNTDLIISASILTKTNCDA